MAKRKRRLTPNQQEWNKQIARLKRVRTKLQKEGYNLPDYFIPDRPKRISKKMLKELKDLTPKKARKRYEYTKYEDTIPTYPDYEDTIPAYPDYDDTESNEQYDDYAIDYDTGEVVEEYHVILDEMRNIIDKYDERTSKKAKAFMDEAISTYGEETAAKRFTAHRADSLANIEVYARESKGEEVLGAINRLYEILNNGALTAEQAKDLEEAKEGVT